MPPPIRAGRRGRIRQPQGREPLQHAAGMMAPHAQQAGAWRQMGQLAPRIADDDGMAARRQHVGVVAAVPRRDTIRQRQAAPGGIGRDRLRLAAGGREHVDQAAVREDDACRQPRCRECGADAAGVRCAAVEADLVRPRRRGRLRRHAQRRERRGDGVAIPVRIQRARIVRAGAPAAGSVGQHQPGADIDDERIGLRQAPALQDHPRASKPRPVAMMKGRGLAARHAAKARAPSTQPVSVLSMSQASSRGAARSPYSAQVAAA